MKLFIIEQRLANPDEKCVASYGEGVDKRKTHGIYVVSEKLAQEDRARRQIRPVIVGEIDPEEGWTIFYADQGD